MKVCRDLFKSCCTTVVFNEVIDQGNKVREYSAVYIMEDCTHSVVLGFVMWKVPNNSWGLHGTDQLEPVFSDLYRLTVSSTLGILVLTIYLLEKG